MKRTKDTELKRHGKLKPQKTDTGRKKNIRTHSASKIVVAGKQGLKYIKTLPLTPQLKQLLGRCVFKILPEEMKQPGILPKLSLFLDAKNGNLVLHATHRYYEDAIIDDGDGHAHFERVLDLNK